MGRGSIFLEIHLVTHMHTAHGKPCWWPPEGPARQKARAEGGSIEQALLLRGDFCNFITPLQPPPPREATFTNTSFMKFKELAAAQSRIAEDTWKGKRACLVSKPEEKQF